MRGLLCRTAVGLLLAGSASADAGFDQGFGRFAMRDATAGAGDCAATLHQQGEMIRSILLSTFETAYVHDGPTGLRAADAPMMARPRPRLAVIQDEAILPAPVPLPGAGALLLGGLAAGIAVRAIRRRRTRASQPHPG